MYICMHAPTASTIYTKLFSNAINDIWQKPYKHKITLAHHTFLWMNVNQCVHGFSFFLSFYYLPPLSCLSNSFGLLSFKRLQFFGYGKIISIIAFHSDVRQESCFNLQTKETTFCPFGMCCTKIATTYTHTNTLTNMYVYINSLLTKSIHYLIPTTYITFNPIVKEKKQKQQPNSSQS